MTGLQDRIRNNIWRKRNTHEYWKIQRELQGWKA